MTPKTLWIGLVIVIILIGGLFIFRSNDADDAENATTTPATTTSSTGGSTATGGTGGTAQPVLANGTYTLDTEESLITWTGKKPLVLGYEDTGTFAIKSGTVKVSDGVVVSGEFFIDMDSLVVTKTSNTKIGMDKLENHLRSTDFFAIETYPNAKFVLTSVVNGQVTGDLTIKNKTAPISFPAAIRSESETRLVAQAALVMNRATWDIRYGSDTFFDNLGDNLIADEVQLSLKLVATK
ncbi:MAG: YceI family protein [Patescibacteria group bacterium]